MRRRLFTGLVWVGRSVGRVPKKGASPVHEEEQTDRDSATRPPEAVIQPKRGTASLALHRAQRRCNGVGG